MAAATFITLITLLSFSDSVTALFRPTLQFPPTGSTRNDSPNALESFALGKVLNDASPVFGIYVEDQGSYSTWMKAYPDSTPLVHMNIPGTHDAATWNYSLATQEALTHVTDLVNDTQVPPSALRCHDRSMMASLSAGIRAFDLRYAYDVTNTSIVFWHGPGLQSETATVDDVLYGFYHWLDQHPSEALFLSFQYEGGTSMYSTSDAALQRMLFDTLSSPAAREYVLQTSGTIGTLGQARGKITLLKRFDLDMLPDSYSDLLPGIQFSPKDWTENSPNLTLVYNDTTAETAYIEDYYQPLTEANSTYEENIRWKYNATEAHLRMAATTHPDGLFWSFASSHNWHNDPSVTPRIQAVGLGNDYTPNGGVNQQLVNLFKTMQGKRLGIVMFDFYETPNELLPLFLSLASDSD